MVQYNPGAVDVWTCPKCDAVKPNFKVEALAWLVEKQGHAPIGMEAKLAELLESFYDRGHRAGQLEIEAEIKKRVGQ